MSTEKPTTELPRIKYRPDYDSRMYHAFYGIIARTTKPTHPSWHRYGGRGILVHEELATFELFCEHVRSLPDWPAGCVDIPEHLSIDRRDNDKGYEKGNLRLATRTVQANNRHNNRLETMNGVTKTMAEWCKEIRVVHKATVERRMKTGWTFEAAITTPSKTYKGKK